MLVLPLAGLTAGCAVLGVAANATSVVKVTPRYTRLKGQTIGVIVSVDRATRNDHPSLQLDISQGVWRKLQQAQLAKAEELVGTVFPKDRGPDAVYTFQQNNPGLTDSMVDVAPRLGVSRLIYVEVDDFGLHPDSVPELFRGMLSARVQVIEVAGGKGTSAFSEAIQVFFPENSPEEGMPDVGESKTYVGTLDAFTTKVLQKFVTYEEGR